MMALTIPEMIPDEIPFFRLLVLKELEGQVGWVSVITSNTLDHLQLSQLSPRYSDPFQQSGIRKY